MKQRRGSPRYALTAGVEITEILSDARFKAKTGDLSLHGCFIDMMNPCPEGTEIRLRISHAEATFTAIGRVMFTLPNAGMGVMFTSVDAAQLSILLKWIGELSGKA